MKTLEITLAVFSHSDGNVIYVYANGGYTLQAFHAGGSGNEEGALYNRVNAEPSNNILVLMSYGAPAHCNDPCAAAFSLVKAGTARPGSYGKRLVLL